MPSRIIPLEDLKERSVMFWLPPGGQHNEVWADTWMNLAELEPADAAPALALLRDNDIGGYIASPSGRKGAASTVRQLYVDREQENRATDVLMLFLRGRNQQAVPVQRKRVARPVRTLGERPAAVRILLIVLKVVFVAGLIALGLLLAYYRGPSLFPTVHPAHHPAPASNAPGMTQPTWTAPGP
jgi:hypothetical protein